MSKESTKGYYFTEDTENAIIRYNTLQDPIERAVLFEQDIYPAFYKLAENIIHTFKFYYTDTHTIEELKHTIITMLLEEKIRKFNPEVGAKAYSYFGTIVKRWLINYNNQNFKELKRVIDIDSVDLDLVEDQDYEEESSITLSDLFDLFVDSTYLKLTELFPKTSDQAIADAILTLFKTRKDLQLIRKKALYLYIKEMVDCRTSDLTAVLKVLKVEFYELHRKYDSKGLLNNF